MRTDRPHKPDSMSLLFILVSLGMLISTYVHAEDYLFSEPGAYSSVMNLGKQHALELSPAVVPSSKNSWLIPGSSGVRTSIKGSMAHFQFDSHDEGEVSGLLPSNTRFIFSMGWEEDILPDSVYKADATEDWYDHYKPMLFFTVDHRW